MRGGSGWRAVLLGALLAVTWAAGAQSAEPQPGDNPRLDGLIGHMTLDEKIDMLHGATDPASLGQAGYVGGVPRLGIPPLRLADGPAGVRVTQPGATALPAPEALAATFSGAWAREFGRVIGREGRALGQDVLLSPMTNLVRTPYAGRTFETFGEDPLLASRIVAEEIRGIQGEGLIATVKHYAANNQETDRQTINVKVGERTLRETELQPFEAAVDAAVGAVMCAYNRVNGVYACENDHLLNQILRDEWGFGGWVMTDWGARHTALGAEAVEAGLDMEMPRPCFFATTPTTTAGFGCTAGAPTLKTAVQDGSVAESTVDQAVRHILVQMDRFGLLAETPPARPQLDPQAGAQTAQAVAENGAVLLRNERRGLPLSRRDLRSLALIGPTARTPLIGGGGSARVIPAATPESPLAALRRHGADAGWATGLDLDGVAIPSSALAPPAGSTGPGLLRTGTGTNAGATPRVDATLDYTAAGNALDGGPWEWNGTLTVPGDGLYDLSLQLSAGSAQLFLDGATTPTVNAAVGGIFPTSSLIPTADGLGNTTQRVTLTAGTHQIRITAAAAPAAGRQIRLAWVTPERRAQQLEAAADLAASARKAVVFAYDEGTEGADRTTLSLPHDQDDVIAAVTAANPNTVVVLNTGDPVTMPWAEDTRAILELWYPGQEGAEATARLLLGDSVPSAKLPMTFPASDDATPFAGHPERFPGVTGPDGLPEQEYSEGIFFGYRWYDQQDVEPLFEFGRGLSYTRFAYSRLRVQRERGGGYRVRFRIRITGRRRGVEVPQVYVGAPRDPPVEMAAKTLAGFGRVDLRPGASRAITLRVDRRQLSFWSEDAHRWVLPSGRRSIYVGSSSRAIRLQARA